MNRKIKLPPSHSTLSPIAAEGRKTQGGAEKIINLLIHDYLKLKIMTKKMKLVATLATLLIAAAGVMTFEACNKKDDQITNQETLTRESTSPNYSIELLESMANSVLYRSDIRQVFDSCSMIMKKCIETPTPVNMLTMNEADFCDRVGISLIRYNAINNYISSTMRNIITSYPDLFNYAKDNSICVECEEVSPYEKIQSMIDYYKSHPNVTYDLSCILNNTQSGQDNNGGCNDNFQYMLCLLVCTASGPLIYWPCAFLCLCQYCPDICNFF